MLDQEDIEQQQQLLAIHRRTLRHSLRQHKTLGVLAPPALTNGIHECWINISQIKADLRAIGVEITDEPEDEPRDLAITVLTLPPLERRNRSRMLEKVRIIWIKGVLEKSLHEEVLITLNMEERSDAIARPWDMVLREHYQPNRMLPPGTKIIDVFDDLGGELLILGAPGSGKTTMLLELARDLITHAEQDETYPMPVVFNLSSWMKERKPIPEWLVDELSTKYDIPRKIGKAWIEADQLLPLLDGLDEVKEEHRNACVEAINMLRRKHGLVNLVICSRVADYEALTARLKLQGAVLIQPLTAQQIDTYLASAGDHLGTLRVALIEDAALSELAASPLTLSILTLVYQGMPIDALSLGETVETHRKHIFGVYVDRMFARRGTATLYTQQQATHYLGRLAQVLSQNAQSVFLIERMQPDWALSSGFRAQATFTTGLLFGMVWGTTFGLAIGLVLGPFIGLMFGLAAGVSLGITQGVNGGLTRGLAGGLIGGVISELNGGQTERLTTVLTGGMIGVLVGRVIVGGFDIWFHKNPTQITFVETVTWSWSRLRSNFKTWLTRWLAIGLVFGLAVGLVFRPVAGLAFMLGIGLGTGLLTGLTGGEIEMKMIPNQGIWRSARNALRIGVATMVAAGLVFGLMAASGLGLMAGLTFGLGYAFVSGTPASMSYGGAPCLSHLALRLVLYRSGSIPWNYARFLDHCAERIFLRKVGGGYIFIHRMLMEYFASLDISEQEHNASPFRERP